MKAKKETKTQPGRRLVPTQVLSKSPKKRLKQILTGDFNPLAIFGIK